MDEQLDPEILNERHRTRPFFGSIPGTVRPSPVFSETHRRVKAALEKHAAQQDFKHLKDVVRELL